MIAVRTSHFRSLEILNWTKTLDGTYIASKKTDKDDEDREDDNGADDDGGGGGRGGGGRGGGGRGGGGRGGGGRGDDYLPPRRKTATRGY